MEALAILFGVITGGCLLIIQVRVHVKKGLPLFGSILSDKLLEEIDKIDKTLAFFALISFLIMMFCIVNTF